MHVFADWALAGVEVKKTAQSNPVTAANRLTADEVRFFREAFWSGVSGSERVLTRCVAVATLQVA